MLTQERAQEIERAANILLDILRFECPCPCCEGTGDEGNQDVFVSCPNCLGVGYEIPDEFDVLEEICDEVLDADLPS